MPLIEADVLHLLMRWRTRISAAAWVVARDAHVSEDIFQNVAIKALTKGVQFETEAALLSWAFITARREALDWIKHYRREIAALDAEILETMERNWINHPLPPTDARVEALQDCLISIPSESKRILTLRYAQGHSCEEVAKAMGIGLAAIYKRLSRLHESLRLCVEGKLSTFNSHPRTMP
jgi:RNA polymerase sigma factor (sigma-70 family)